MFPTPNLSHLSKEDKLHVYDPAGMFCYSLSPPVAHVIVEDTFLLLDCLEQDVEQLRNQNPSICLEIGSGSGCVSAFLGSILGSANALYLCTDINNRASICTFATGKQNKIPLDPITCDLSEPLKARLRNSVDIILFNPPYVPTACEESYHAQGNVGITSAWAGGTCGMEVTNRFLDVVGDLLSDSGKFYLVALAQNNIPDIRERMWKQFNLGSRVVLQRHAGREHLSVVCFSR